MSEGQHLYSSVQPEKCLRFGAGIASAVPTAVLCTLHSGKRKTRETAVLADGWPSHGIPAAKQYRIYLFGFQFTCSNCIDNITIGS